MSIDCCLPPHEPQIRKYRAPSSWGKIRLEWRDMHIPKEGLDEVLNCGDSRKVEKSGVEYWNQGEVNIRPCSVRLERYQSSTGLFWEVEKVKLQDETVELQYNGVAIQEINEVKSEVQNLKKKTSRNSNCRGPARSGDRTTKMFTSKDRKPVCGGGEPLIEASHMNEKHPNENIGNFSCPKCDKKFQTSSNMRHHAVSHYKHLLYDLLPDKAPFCCPICSVSHDRRQALMRHYAYGHEKVFQLTDLTPEDLKFSRKKCEKSRMSETEEKRLNELLSPNPPDKK